MGKGNKAFWASERKNGEEWSVSLEVYRRIFLDYLDVAEAKLELASVAPALKMVRQILEGQQSGVAFRDFEAAAAEKAGDFLRYRYGMEFSHAGLRMALEQFDAEQMTLQLREIAQWQMLMSAIESINEAEAGGCSDWNVIWCENGSEQQRKLLNSDSRAADRVRHYRKTLSDFEEKPLPPYTQETLFVAHGSAIRRLLSYR